MFRLRSLIPILLILLFALIACEPLAPYRATPVAVVVTGIPTATVAPTVTPTPTITRTPVPTATPDYTPSPTPFPCEETTGEFVDFNENLSNIANENLRYRVYLPPCYGQLQKRFPTLILLHGLSYREQQWDELGLDEALDQGIRLGLLPPMVVVMPWMGTIGQLNQFPPDPSYELVILEELLPRIENIFCTIENAEHRAIGGISRGGFWAFSLAMRHPDIFGIAGSHSGYFPSDLGEIPAPFNPLEIATNSSFLQSAGLRLYMDNGASDSSGPSQQRLSARLTGRSIPHTYQVHPVGEHNEDYWSAHVSEYLEFYGEDWERDYNQLPTCAEPSP